MRIRVPVVFAVSLFLIAFEFSAGIASAQERVCAGSCDEYGDPIYNVSDPYDDGLRHSPRYEDDHSFDTPGYVEDYEYRSERRYKRYQRTSRYKHHRRYKRRSYRRVYHDDWSGGIDTSNRTEFCREHYERRGNGWIKRKVKVRRCVWVRNDLLGNGAYRSRYSDEW